MQPHCVRKYCRSRGFSLVEALLASMILAFSAVAVSHALLSGHQLTEAALHHSHAMDLAGAMVEEVLRLPYDDPDGSSNMGPESGESNRTLYDNVDDYHGFSQSAGAVADFAGDLYEPAYQDFNREVTVTTSSQNVVGFGGAIDGVTIQVTITDTAGTAWTVQRFVPES